MSIRTLNRVELLGNITKEPKMFETRFGHKVMLVTVVTNETFFDEKLNEWRSKPYYLEVKAWDNLASIYKEKLRIGTKVMIIGRLRSMPRKYGDKLFISVNEVHASDIIILRQPN